MRVADDVVDLSMPFYEGMPTDDLGPKVWERMSYAYARQLQADTQTRCGRLILTTDHTGTHVDGPLRFDPKGTRIEQVPLERFIAPACLLDLRGLGRNATIGRRELEAAGAGRLRKGDAAVLWTGHDRHINEAGYFWDRPQLTVEGAQYLAERGPGLVACDFPGLGRPGDHSYEVKRVLHRAGALTVEQLRNLSPLAGKSWHLFAAPLRVRGGAGSIIRACGLVNWKATQLADLTLDLHGKMPSLGAVPTFWTRASHELTSLHSKGDYSYQSHAMLLNEHAGTHLDAPCHFDESGASIDELPLAALVVRARLLDLRHKKALEPIEPHDLEHALEGRPLAPGEAAVVWTGHSGNYDSDDYGEVRPFISAAGADWIVRKRPSLLVTDLIGLDEPADLTQPVHNRILLAGMCMLQVTTGLAALSQGKWDICAFPIKLVRGTGAPLRAFAARVD
jgi:kynurenine formamidase